MAQQESFIKLKGKIGDLTFFKTKNGYQAREKGGVSGDRIANDPAFSRTRENNLEFGRACAASKKLRDVLRSSILFTADTKMSNRLTSRLSRMIKADTENIRGERKVLAANLGLLKDFNFNAAAQLSATLFVNYQAVIERSSGSVQLNLPAFNPDIAVVKPAGATHYQFNAAAALLDFDGDESEFVAATTSAAPLNTLADAQTLEMSLTANSSLPILVVFGISFFQEVNGLQYSLKNGAHNALTIFAIDLP